MASLAARISALATIAAQTIKQRAVPAGGGTGQVLVKTGAGDWAAAWATRAVRFRSASRTSGNVGLNGSTLVDFDTSLDLVLPAAVDDLLEVILTTQCDTSSGNATAVDFAVHILAGGVAKRGVVGDTGSVISNWTARSGDYNPGGGLAATRIVASDLTDGTVTLRLKARTGGAARTVFATTSNPTVFAAKVSTLS